MRTCIASSVIASGGNRDASLIVHRWPGKNTLGKKLNVNSAVAQLQAAEGDKPVSEAGEYSLSLADLGSGGRKGENEDR